MHPLLRCGVVGMTLMWSSSAESQPSPATSTVPSYIDLVGIHAGVPDPHGVFTVVVRDAASQPIASTAVRLVFGGCPDVRPAAVQPFPGSSVDCGGNVVTASTDATGRAQFDVVGSVLHRATASGSGCAQVRADPGDVLLKSVTVTAADEDGIDGITANDLALCACDATQLLSYRARSDFDHNGTTFAPDLPALQTLYFAENSTETGARCDGAPATSPTLASDGFRLTWGDCASGGGMSQVSFSCNSNTGSLPPIVASIIAPPGINSLTGFDATLDVIGEPGSTLPGWWQFQTGGCRSGAMTVAAGGATTCADAFASGATLARVADYPHGQPNVERIRIVGFVTSPVALQAGTEYDLFQVMISKTMTTTCTGCDQPVLLQLESARLLQGGGCGEPAAPALSAGMSATNNVFMQVAMGQPQQNAQVRAQGRFTNVGPGPGAFDLRLANANPTRGDITVDFSVPSFGSAILTISDIAGRRIVERIVDNVGLGVHRLTLARPGEVHPGMYLVTLRGPDGVAKLKAVVVR